MADKKAEAGKKQKKESRAVKFFRDTRSEFKKISWPTRKQVWNNTLVVLVTVAIFAVVVWGLDFVLNSVRDLVIGWFS